MLVRRILFLVFLVMVGTTLTKAYRAITTPSRDDALQSGGLEALSRPPGQLPILPKMSRFGKTGLLGIDAKKKKLVFDRDGRFKVSPRADACGLSVPCLDD